MFNKFLGESEEYKRAHSFWAVRIILGLSKNNNNDDSSSLAKDCHHLSSVIPLALIVRLIKSISYLIFTTLVKKHLLTPFSR